MIKLNTVPGKLRSLLALCIVGAAVFIGITFWVYSVTRHTAQVVGSETVPQIIAAKNIRATLASAHSNAMNAMLTKEKLGGKFWTLYRKDLNTLHSQLVVASENISYGELERTPLLTILSNVSAYEYTVGGAVSSGAEISVDQFMEANRLMQQKILPSSTALSKANLSQLDSTYNSYINNTGIVIILMSLAGAVFLGILIATQVYVFKKTHRILNLGLLAATIFFSASFIYSMSVLSSVRSDVRAAKQDAFDSLNSLWSAKAEAYNANAIESLYLLHNGTGIVQTADTINFNLSSGRLTSDTKAALIGEKFEGYLSDALGNIDSPEEKAVAVNTVQQWGKYVDIDKQVRSLEYDSRHSDAIALCIGDAAGQSNYEFARFDAALNDIIKIKQLSFDSNIASAFKSLNRFPFITGGFLLLIMAACILGMKARIDEYKL